MIKLREARIMGTFEAGEKRCAYLGSLPGAWYDHSLFLQLAGRIKCDGRVADHVDEGTGASFVAPMVRATIARANKHLKKLLFEKSLQKDFLKGTLGKRRRQSNATRWPIGPCGTNLLVSGLHAGHSASLRLMICFGRSWTNRTGG